MPLVVVACVVEPVREWCQRIGNRLVFGARLSPRDAMRALVDRFSGVGDVDELTELTRVVVDSTRATRATLWLMTGDRLLSWHRIPRRGVRTRGFRWPSRRSRWPRLH